jgi:MYXO-CTERM domain-containing protein
VPAGVGGCTSTGAMPSVAGLLALLAVVGAPSRRRSRPSSKVFEPIA